MVNLNNFVPLRYRFGPDFHEHQSDLYFDSEGDEGSLVSTQSTFELTCCQRSFLQSPGQIKHFTKLFSELAFGDDAALRKTGQQDCHSHHNKQLEFHVSSF